ncbi:MAG: hypothetical protein KME21_31720 [Desmonostoc vinosum HA7617-LM4]|jgi:hypothetical protein|nr:hypothetical protein [Desmonostoc vinosum HA7617-LM4]
MKIRRRRFGQIAIASAAIAVFTDPVKKVAAQSQSTIYGVRFATSSNNRNPMNASVTNNNELISHRMGRVLKPSETANIDNTSPQISVISFNFYTGQQLSHSEISANQVENLNARTEVASKAVFCESTERLTSFTALSRNRFVITSVVHLQQGNFTRLLFIRGGQSSRFQKALKVWGFKNKNSTLESLMNTQNDQLISLISQQGGVFPFELATIDSRTGKVDYDALTLPDLQPNRSYRHLTLSPIDGKIYATTMGAEGGVFLVQFDMQNKSIITGKPLLLKLSELSYNKQHLENDLLSLAVSPLGQLYALAAPNNEPTNSLFSIDEKTGKMTLIRPFAVDKIAFAV